MVERIRSVFQAYDADASGRIEEGEFAAVVSAFGCDRMGRQDLSDFFARFSSDDTMDLRSFTLAVLDLAKQYTSLSSFAEIMECGWWGRGRSVTAAAHRRRSRRTTLIAQFMPFR